MALVEDDNKANNEDANEADLDSPSGSQKAPLLESYKNDEHCMFGRRMTFVQFSWKLLKMIRIRVIIVLSDTFLITRGGAPRKRGVVDVVA
ncbi:hypothetical protein YC2023_025329 [Brassica napus]